MRISTAQMFQQNTQSLTKGQSATNKILEQLASGKKVNTAGDDPVAAIGIDNLKQKNTLVDQYVKNIDYAKNRLGVTESKIGSTETLIDSMRQQLQKGANGSLSQSERQMVADEMRTSLDELLSIANAKDESGNYLFSGTKTNTPPFAFNNNGEIVYSGDSGVRQSIVASGVTVGTNVPGDSIFMNAPNPLGDYGVNYLPSQQGDFLVDSASIVDPSTYVEDTYTFNFVANGSDVDLNILDSNGAVVSTVPNFDPSTPVSFNGIEVQLSGEPVAGDSFTMEPQATVSILDELNSAIALLEDPDLADTPEGNSKLAQLLNSIDSGQKQVSVGRSVAGNSLKGLESIETNHAEEKIVNGSALSMLEDLDYAAAITEFEKQQLALNAVSSVFAKVGSISLFDYI
ncbi:flagellar hook-associated protein FlgL [Shewanella donghaensis]|uniref:flagellar hook-associated protein FlgL n=1 Tax=Shewanella donghaensis TaxID=238836 RepID=UPI0011835FB1|nr:flagellar hook-associated protein FlgL [Shewanella donghaensis]